MKFEAVGLASELENIDIDIRSNEMVAYDNSTIIILTICSLKILN